MKKIVKSFMPAVYLMVIAFSAASCNKTQAAPAAVAAPGQPVDLTYAADKALPAVVYIKSVTNSKVQTVEYSDPFEDFFSDPFGGFFGRGQGNNGNGRRRQVQTPKRAAAGSGVIISADGYIVTNYHVIEKAYSNNLDVTVMTFDGTEYSASIVGFETGNDIAVLKIDATGLSPVTFGNSDAITMGEIVYAVGNPLGELAYSMSTGTVSGLDREIITEESMIGINMFQIDAAVNPGNSGGPVYNSRGEVIGIVTAKSDATNAEGLGFAIPVNDASSIANDLMTKGYVTGKAYMGVRLDERYNSMYAQYYNMPLGAYVYSVDSGSAAEKAGLQAGDIITKIGEAKISSYTDLKAAVRGYSAGDSTEITLFRAGESLSVSIVFDEVKPEGTLENSNEVLDPYSSEQH